MYNQNLSLLISSCEKFSDLWAANVKLLNDNWEDRGIKTFLLTDVETSKKLAKIEIIAAGSNLMFSVRLKEALKIIETKYVLLTLDDYFLINKINNEKIDNLIRIMENEKIDYIRLFKSPNSRKKFLKYNKIYKINYNKEYQINLYPAIWKKEFLEKTITGIFDAWHYEFSLTSIAKSNNALCLMSKNKEFPILDVVRKGKVLHKANRYFKKNGLNIGDREIISYKEEFRIFIFTLGKKILPRRIAILVKKILMKVGFNFYSSKIKGEKK